jgi:hypothetical protein
LLIFRPVANYTICSLKSILFSKSPIPESVLMQWQRSGPVFVRYLVRIFILLPASWLRCLLVLLYFPDIMHDHRFPNPYLLDIHWKEFHITGRCVTVVAKTVSIINQ